MVASRRRPLAAFTGSFWLCALLAVLAPSSIGYQDLAAYLARQPGVSERWRDHLIASPFGTIHAATFSFARPIGTTLSEPIGARPVNFDSRSLDVKVWFGGSGSSLLRPALQVAYPSVNRRLKGNRLPSAEPAPASGGAETLPPLQPVTAPAADPTPLPAPPPPPSSGPRPKSVERLDDSVAAPVDAFGSLPNGLSVDEDVTASLPPGAATASERGGAHDAETDDDAFLADKPPEIPAAGENAENEPAASPYASQSFLNEDPAERNSQLYFGGGVMGARNGLEQWPLGAEPVLVSRARDPDMKLATLEAPAGAELGGESFADKDGGGPPVTPAVRLGLEGKERAKAEKCLADAVYFESRGEPLRGQMAVAQVIMNRVFSGYYPNNVCGVVYQNAHRHLRCQFTFACEGKDLSKVDELDMWEQAKTISRDMLDGKIWLTEVGHATHYHAYWVHPSWVHEMKKMYRLGVHTFYRPRAWSDVPEGPVWATVPVPAKSTGPSAQNPDAKEPDAGSKTPEAAAKIPQAAASPEPEDKIRTAPL
jgi:Cell Wall Hydrolase